MARTLTTFAELVGYLIDLLGVEAVAQAAGASADDVAAWSAGDAADDRIVGDLIAFARERYRVAIGGELMRVSRERRSRYMREYVKARRKMGLLTEKEVATAIAYREQNEQTLRDKAKDYHKSNRQTILRKKAERRRENALAELFAFTPRIEDPNK